MSKLLYYIMSICTYCNVALLIGTIPLMTIFTVFGYYEIRTLICSATMILLTQGVFTSVWLLLRKLEQVKKKNREP